MRRVTELDAVRALAALNVLIYHLRPQAFALHGIRVDLFLVLSGYLITTIVLKKSRADNFYPIFYGRRILRIWPSYFLALLALAAVNLVLPKPFPMNGLANYMTFTQNIQYYWSDRVPPFSWCFLHTWSLALEEQFYLIWPVLVGLVGRRRLVPMAIGMLVMTVSARIWGFHWWLLVARCDGFALGSLLAVLFLDGTWADRHRPSIRRGLGLTALGGVGAIAVTWSASWSLDMEAEMSLWPSLMILSFNLFFFAIIGLIICQTGHPSLRILRIRPLRYLGRISYGLYLYHPLVYLVCFAVGYKLGVGEVWWVQVLKIGVSIGVASLSWHLIEEPISRLKTRLSYRTVPHAETYTQGGRLQTAEA